MNINDSCYNWKKNAALFLTGQALSLFGTMIVQYAILWHVVLKSQSGSMMTFFTVAGLLPLLFISPFAGVWADRYNRKYIINIADGTVALFSLLAAIYLMLGYESYALLFVCAFVRAVGQGVQMPAVGAFIPQIVPEEHLTRVNGINGSIQAMITLISPMAGAALMAFTKLEYMFLLDVVTASIGISIVLFFVKVPAAVVKPVVVGTDIDINVDTNICANVGTNITTDDTNVNENIKKTSYLHELKEGLKYIRGHGYVLRMIIIVGINVFLISPVAFLTPLQVTRNFGAEVWRLGAIEIGFSAGMMAGGLLIGIWGGFKNRVYTMAAAFILSGLLTSALGILTPAFFNGVLGAAAVFGLYIAVMALVGVIVTYINTPSMVMLQTTVEPAYMGRVFSVFTMISGGVMPLGMIVFGPMSDIEFTALGLSTLDWILVITGIMASLLFIPMVTSKTLVAAGARHLKQ